MQAHMRIPPLSSTLSPQASRLLDEPIVAWQRRLKGSLNEIQTIRRAGPMPSDAAPSVNQVVRALERALVVLDSLGSSDRLEPGSHPAAASRASGRRPFNDVSRRRTLS